MYIQNLTSFLFYCSLNHTFDGVNKHRIPCEMNFEKSFEKFKFKWKISNRVNCWKKRWKNIWKNCMEVWSIVQWTTINYCALHQCVFNNCSDISKRKVHSLQEKKEIGKTFEWWVGSFACQVLSLIYNDKNKSLQILKGNVKQTKFNGK